MKHKLGVVFGHYDSRGGTTFIEIPNTLKASIEKAKDRYNVDFFGWDPATNRAENAGVGRQCDILVDQLVRGEQSPADADFLWVARLIMPDDFTMDDRGADLENYGIVFADDPPTLDGRPQWTSSDDMASWSSPEYKAYANLSSEWHARNERHVASATKRKPVRVEFVPVEEKPQPQIPEGQHLYDNPELAKAHQAKWEAWVQDRLDQAKAKAHYDWSHVEEVPRWDDDAYGFLAFFNER